MAVPTDNQAPLSSPSHTSEHQRVSDALALLVSTPWIALPFSANWSNYASGFELGSYRKVGDIVQLQGLITTTVTGSQTIAVLPAGFRPKRQHLVVVMSANATAAIRVDYLTDGTITTNMAVAGWISLSGCWFSTTGL